MQIIRTLPPLLAIALLHAPPAHGASSDWHHVDGGSIRIVTSGAPDAEGRLRGALEIRLAPGWKTYWLDPGDSGVPPTLDISAGGEPASVEIGFPAPQRFDDGYSLWAGYDHPVALALTFSLPQDAGRARIEASAFLGVCETICIPVQAELEIDLRAGADDADDAAVVEAAFAALPEPAGPGFGARAVAVEDDSILIEALPPAGAKIVDLFLAGTQTLALGVPERLEGGDAHLFSVPVLGRHGDGPEDAVAYTLVTSAGAVTGRLALD